MSTLLLLSSQGRGLNAPWAQETESQTRGPQGSRWDKALRGVYLLYAGREKERGFEPRVPGIPHGPISAGA